MTQYSPDILNNAHLIFACAGYDYLLFIHFSFVFFFFYDDMVGTGLGPLKEDVSRVGYDDDDKQAKGMCLFSFLFCFSLSYFKSPSVFSLWNRKRDSIFVLFYASTIQATIVCLPFLFMHILSFLIHFFFNHFDWRQRENRSRTLKKELFLLTEPFIFVLNSGSHLFLLK